MVEPSNPKAFQDAMRILWDNPQLAETMGMEAKKRYVALFTANQMAESYADLYKLLINSYKKNFIE